MSQVTESEIAQVATHPRVTIADVEAEIACVQYLNPATAPQLTIAVVTLRNGYVVTGESAPADVRNFNESLGQRLALDHAKGKIWPLLGFRLRDIKCL